MPVLKLDESTICALAPTKLEAMKYGTVASFSDVATNSWIAILTRPCCSFVALSKAVAMTTAVVNQAFLQRAR